MEPQPGTEAVRELAHLGYRFTVSDETIKAKYHGPREPDSAKVRQWLETVKANKPEVIHFLKSYCARCGDPATCPDYDGQPLCMKCDWEELIRLYPGMAVVNHGR